MADDLWTCPDCAFSFAAEHTNPDGGYTCPVCAEAALLARLEAAEQTIARCDSEIALHIDSAVEAEHRALAAERERDRLVDALWEFHEFVAAELDPDPSPHPADYLRPDLAEAVRTLAGERPEPQEGQP